MDCALLQGWEHNSSYDMTILYRGISQSGVYITVNNN